jgi:hypothetical protein
MSHPEPGDEDRFVIFAAAMARALREMEDVEDVRDADAAWEETDEWIPLADLEDEFGR